MKGRKLKDHYAVPYTDLKDYQATAILCSYSRAGVGSKRLVVIVVDDEIRYEIQVTGERTYERLMQSGATLREALKDYNSTWISHPDE